jgi:hypothetical protein
MADLTEALEAASEAAFNDWYPGEAQWDTVQPQLKNALREKLLPSLVAAAPFLAAGADEQEARAELAKVRRFIDAAWPVIA